MKNIQVITGVERKRRFTEEEKRAFVAEVKTSSLTSVARRHGIAHSVLHSWKKRYGSSAFATVSVAPAPELSKLLPSVAAPSIKVHLSPSCTLEFPPTISPAFLAEFIKTLRVLS